MRDRQVGTRGGARLPSQSPPPPSLPREGAVFSHAPFILVRSSPSSCIRRLLVSTVTCPALRACSVAPCTPTPWVPCGVRLCVVYARAECAAGGLAACAWYRIRYSHALFISLSYYRAKPCTAMPPGSECDGSGGYPGSSHSWLGLVGTRRFPEDSVSICFKKFKRKIILENTIVTKCCLGHERRRCILDMLRFARTGRPTFDRRGPGKTRAPEK
jgi:hypothetical protein